MPFPRICIASANRWQFSQTFIRAHVERLPAEIKVLGSFKSGYGDAQCLLSLRFEREINELSRIIRRKALTSLPNFGVRRYLRRHRVDAVLAEFGPTATLLANDCEAVGIPLIAHFHGYDAYSHRILATYRDPYIRLFSTASAIVVVSRHMQSHLETLGAPPAKLFRNPCGVDLDLFCGGSPVTVGPDFLVVGRFVEKKAPEVTLGAFRRTLDACPAAHLTMVGDGPLLRPAKTLAERLGMLDAVDFPGVLTHTEVADSMRRARAFVHHAVTGLNGDREGTPVSVLEAAASGLPVVGTVHGGIPDFVLHERTGYLVEERDADTMSAHMISLARNPKLAASLGAAGQTLVRENGSISRSIARLWQIIRGAMNADFEGIDR